MPTAAIVVSLSAGSGHRTRHCTKRPVAVALAVGSVPRSRIVFVLLRQFD